MRARTDRRERGQALVELALLLPVLLLLLGGIIEFGRVFHAYLVITSASREGARSAVVGETYEEIEEKVFSAATTLDEEKLSFSLEPENYSRGDMLTVTVAYSVDLVFPFSGALVPDPFPLQAATTMRVE